MTSDNTKWLTFKIQRYNPESSGHLHFQDFMVPFERGLTILEGLLYIKENIDSSLTFRKSCRMGICGSCAILVNNYPYLACQTQVEEIRSDRLIIKPLPTLPIIKDLVTDLTAFLNTHKSIKPYIIYFDTDEPGTTKDEFVQLPQEQNTFHQFTHCIKCGICVSACPTSASDRYFLGPQALSQCYRYYVERRDSGEHERVPLITTGHGIWQCHLAGACSEVCPKGVDPALAIQLLKRQMVSRAIRFNHRD